MEGPVVRTAEEREYLAAIYAKYAVGANAATATTASASPHASAAPSHETASAMSAAGSGLAPSRLESRPLSICAPESRPRQVHDSGSQPEGRDLTPGPDTVEGLRAELAASLEEKCVMHQQLIALRTELAEARQQLRESEQRQHNPEDLRTVQLLKDEIAELSRQRDQAFANLAQAVQDREIGQKQAEHERERAARAEDSEHSWRAQAEELEHRMEALRNEMSEALAKARATEDTNLSLTRELARLRQVAAQGPSGASPSSYLLQGQPAYQSGYARDGSAQPGWREGAGQPGYGREGVGQPGYGREGVGQPGYGREGVGQPGYGREGVGQPGFGLGAGQPGYGRDASQSGFRRDGGGSASARWQSDGRDGMWDASQLYGGRPDGVGSHDRFR